MTARSHERTFREAVAPPAARRACQDAPCAFEPLAVGPSDRDVTPLPRPLERPASYGPKPWKLTPAKLMFLLVVVLPTALASIYFRADRVRSFRRRIVLRRSIGQAALGGGLGSLLQMTGIARSQDDAYSVQEFIQSRDAVAALSQRLNLREVFARPAPTSSPAFPTRSPGTQRKSSSSITRGWSRRSTSRRPASRRCVFKPFARRMR